MITMKLFKIKIEVQTIIIIILTFLTLWVYSPILQPVPGRDSGVYIFVAKQLLLGKIPYKDIWDHKPPGIYFIDAFGLTIGHASLWGIWLLEYINLFTATIIIFHLAKKEFCAWPSMLAILLLFTCFLFIGDSGNSPEEYILLCNTAGS